jgi:Uma2 family endonuclease
MPSTLVSVEEYLHTSYSPDREYVDGVVLERNLGEKPHSKILTRLAFLLMHGKRIQPWVEQRVQVSPTRFRVPDVCVTVGEPAEDIFTTPPLICIEILSPEDRLARLQEKIDDYLDFGVRHVWVIDPATRRAYACDRAGMHLITELATSDPELRIPLDQVFE